MQVEKLPVKEMSIVEAKSPVKKKAIVEATSPVTKLSLKKTKTTFPMTLGKALIKKMEEIGNASQAKKIAYRAIKKGTHSLRKQQNRCVYLKLSK